MPKKSNGPTQRQLRVAELIRHRLAEIFIRTDIRDDALKGVFLTVCEVRISPDIHSATVFVMPMGTKDESGAVAALNRHARFIRGELGHSIELRTVPQLEFKLDVVVEQARRVDDLLRSPEVARDVNPRK